MKVETKYYLNADDIGIAVAYMIRATYNPKGTIDVVMTAEDSIGGMNCFAEVTVTSKEPK